MKKLFCLFGSTGDLARRKIFPALDNITELDILAVGRRNSTQEEFKDSFVIPRQLHGRLRYRKIGYSNMDDYAELLNDIAAKEYDEIIFYLSTPPSLFFDVVKGLSLKKLENVKIAFEKPFGDSKETFEELNKAVLKNFKEEQVYRVDHFLGKNAVLEILDFRKDKSHEKYWNNQFIKKIEITALETLGIGTRAGYYDDIGAVKDMIQNHLLQILATTCMDLNTRKKEDIIKNIKVKKNNIFGQYDEYSKEQNVAKGTKTETLAKINLEINTPEFKGIDIVLFTGKKLKEKNTEVRIYFTENKKSPGKIVFQIAPEKKIIVDDKETPIKKQADQDYQNIITGILQDKKEMFASTKELNASWKLVKKIEDTREKLVKYKSHSLEEDF